MDDGLRGTKRFSVELYAKSAFQGWLTLDDGRTLAVEYAKGDPAAGSGNKGDDWICAHVREKIELLSKYEQISVLYEQFCKASNLLQV